ncbi:MmcQ/YjbR family DNA-binding protein [Kribbella sp. NPDC000426]|uniref:MmcQ/YjbR family DNA-binding protein n=1 Tax=Kribbella sp. NPDC000426 TaxID=3154255 RepID=UPI003333B7E5
MASLEDVERLVGQLPETVETTKHGRRTWAVGGKGYAWERPFSKADLKRYGDETPPDGPILAIKVEDLAEKEAVLTARAGDGFFTIPHFNGYAAVLVELDKVPEQALREALLDGWLVYAPANVAKAHLDGR